MWILLVLVAVGVFLYIGDRLFSHRKGEAADGAVSESASMQGEEPVVSVDSDKDSGNVEEESGEECCGLHLVCEKDSLSPMLADVVYYDDEELDRFIGRDENSYSAEEVEEFRDVLMTLRPEDIAGWARSVTQRRLPLPPDVRDELLMLVNEQRNIR